MFDIIGDIHGHSDKLKQLLLKLGYKKKGNSFSHPTRKVCFLGDFIDRGEGILEVLTIVREMIDDGNAYAVMGNHEYYFLAYHLFSKKYNDHCLPHHHSRSRQLQKTLLAFNSMPKAQWEEWGSWFYNLPLYLEFEQFRIAHAFWHESSIEILKTLSCMKEGRWLTPEAIELTSHFVDKATSVEKKAIEMIVKGPEYALEKEFHFYDPENNLRESARIFWWRLSQDNTLPSSLSDNEMATFLLNNILHLPKDDKYREHFIQSFQQHIDLETLPSYSTTEKIFFFGHYWFKHQANVPKILQTNTACLDYSVARNGYLMAYRYDDEIKLLEEKFVWV